MYHLCIRRWLTSAGAVGANSGVSQRRWAAWVYGCSVVILGTASLDGSQVAVAAGSEACWHGQVWRLWVVLRVGTGVSECGLGAAVLIMMTHFQVPQLEEGKDEIGKDQSCSKESSTVCEWAHFGHSSCSQCWRWPLAARLTVKGILHLWDTSDGVQ